jgi:predicted DNA binding CopG/RHH family protein
VLLLMLLCVRTTIDIADELLRKAKTRAVNEGVPLRQVVESALRKHLSNRQTKGGYRLQ